MRNKNVLTNFIYRVQGIYDLKGYAMSKKSKYTSVLLLVLTVYGIVYNRIFEEEILYSGVDYLIPVLLIIAYGAISKGYLEIGQNAMLGVIMTMILVHYEYLYLFHFYGYIIVLLFMTVLIYVKTYQFYGVIAGILIALIGRIGLIKEHPFLNFRVLQS